MASTDTLLPVGVLTELERPSNAAAPCEAQELSDVKRSRYLWLPRR